MRSDENMDLWKLLSKTDPDQTQSFKKTGGYSGTAVKPIYLIQKMTSVFGPCGEGWVISKPDFQVVPGHDKLVAVYCTVTVAVRKPGSDEMSAPIPGVGGDIVVAGRKSGPFLDDEAFKKAYTDAIGNALKMLGVSADIHMGRFDDSKYVQHLREEKSEARQAARENGNGNGKPTNGGYQNKFVKSPNEQTGDDGPPPHIDEPPPCGPDDMSDHDPRTGEVIEGDDSLTVTLQDGAIVGVATLAEAYREIATCIEQDHVGWFEATQIAALNKKVIDMMAPKPGAKRQIHGRDMLNAILSEKQQLAKQEGQRLSGVA